MKRTAKKTKKDVKVKKMNLKSVVKLKKKSGGSIMKINFPRKFDVKLCVITMADKDDVKKLEASLRSVGKELQGKVYFEDNGSIKGGAYLWKRDVRFGNDEFILIMIAGKRSLLEGKVTKKGLFDLKKFHIDYPSIPIMDIGTFVTAKDVVTASEMNPKKSEVPKTEGFTLRDLNFGCLITLLDEDFNKLYEKLKKFTGENEIFKTNYKTEDINLIFWHRQITGKADDYWVLLVLDKDIALFDQGPNIDKFKKEHKGRLPLIEWGAIGTTWASTLIKDLEEAKKNLKSKVKK